MGSEAHLVDVCCTKGPPETHVARDPRCGQSFRAMAMLRTVEFAFLKCVIAASPGLDRRTNERLSQW